MRLCTVENDQIAPVFVLELGEKLVRAPQALEAFGFSEKDRAMAADCLSYFQHLPKSEKVLRTLLARISEEPKRLARPAPDGQPYLLPQSKVRYLPPIARPGKILCIGLNYRDHCEEQGREIPKKPLVFAKFHTCLVGAGREVPLPFKLDKTIDYEVELALVIGKTARRVTKKSGGKHIAGYTIVNDVSARKIQKEERQWTRAKGFDNSCPIGPAIVTADEIPDPGSLSVSMKINGEIRQQSNTANLIFSPAEIVSFISQAITLEAGDIIATGTPGGVGVYRDPPVFLREGDEMRAEIDRLGALINHCTQG